MKKMQWICILIMAVGCIGMGAHLFLDDGIANPTGVLTVFAMVFAIGMAGNLITAILRFDAEIREKRKSE